VRNRFFLLVLLALSLLSAAPSGAEVFRWQDASGRKHYGDQPAAGAETLPDTEQHAVSSGFHKVRHVHDGDTVILEDGTRVRLLGINTPEIDGKYTQAESGGEAARRWLQKRVEGRTVRLETDREREDKYGRLLAHLFAEDGEHLNLALVEQGLAVVSLYPPNLKYAEALLAAQQRAETAARGMWGSPAYRPRSLDALKGKAKPGWGRWRGAPSRVEHGAHFSRLVFPSGAEAHIDARHRALFPPLEHYLSRPLEIRGWASAKRGHPVFWLRHPSALVETGG
jgi:micrococcal nuclease